MIINGKSIANISCRMCRFRHPPDLTCAEAALHAAKNKIEPEPPMKFLMRRYSTFCMVPRALELVKEQLAGRVIVDVRSTGTQSAPHLTLELDNGVVVLLTAEGHDADGIDIVMEST